MNRWNVLLEFNRAPAFEMLVYAENPSLAIVKVEQAACDTGWADYELRNISVIPVLPRKEASHA